MDYPEPMHDTVLGTPLVPFSLLFDGNQEYLLYCVRLVPGTFQSLGISGLLFSKHSSLARFGTPTRRGSPGAAPHRYSVVRFEGDAYRNRTIPVEVTSIENGQCMFPQGQDQAHRMFRVFFSRFSRLEV